MKKALADFSRIYVDEFLPNYVGRAFIPFFYFCSLSALAYTIWEKSFGSLIATGAIVTIVALLSVPAIFIGFPIVILRDALNPPTPRRVSAPLTVKSFGRGALDAFKSSILLIILGLIAMGWAKSSIALLGFGFGILLNENQLLGLYSFFLFGILAGMATSSYMKARRSGVLEAQQAAN